MPRIHQTSFIKAPSERVFDLSRHLSLFKKAFESKKERMLSGAASNLLTGGDTITLQASHLGKTRTVTLRINEVDPQNGFSEEQVRGDLISYRHVHHFKKADNGTIMIDLVDYELPRDLLGKMIGKYFIHKYFQGIIYRRNQLIRAYAESEKWKPLLMK